MIMTNHSLTELEQFENWLTANGNSENTRSAYIQRIGDFLSFTGGKVTRESIEQYFLNLQKIKKSKTVNCYRDAIIAYLDFKDLEIRLPKRHREEKKNPDWVSQERVEEQIIPLAEQTFKDVDRIAAILYLLFSSGLRRSEICNLKREHINLDKLTGKVYRQKNKDWHDFYFDAETALKLRTYFSSSEEEINALNVNKGGINYIFRVLKKENLLKDIKLRPHLFRHSLLTHMLKKNVNLKRIQEVAGHQHLSSTERYLPSIKEDTEKAYRECMRRETDKPAH